MLFLGMARIVLRRLEQAEEETQRTLLRARPWSLEMCSYYWTHLVQGIIELIVALQNGGHRAFGVTG
jgi:hypothetical protein